MTRCIIETLTAIPLVSSFCMMLLSSTRETSLLANSPRLLQHRVKIWPRCNYHLLPKDMNETTTTCDLFIHHNEEKFNEDPEIFFNVTLTCNELTEQWLSTSESPDSFSLSSCRGNWIPTQSFHSFDKIIDKNSSSEFWFANLFLSENAASDEREYTMLPPLGMFIIVVIIGFLFHVQNSMTPMPTLTMKGFIAVFLCSLPHLLLQDELLGLILPPKYLFQFYEYEKDYLDITNSYKTAILYGELLLAAVLASFFSRDPCQKHAFTVEEEQDVFVVSPFRSSGEKNKTSKVLSIHDMTRSTRSGTTGMLSTASLSSSSTTSETSTSTYTLQSNGQNCITEGDNNRKIHVYYEQDNDNDQEVIFHIKYLGSDDESDLNITNGKTIHFQRDGDGARYIFSSKSSTTPHDDQGSPPHARGAALDTGSPITRVIGRIPSTIGHCFHSESVSPLTMRTNSCSGESGAAEDESKMNEDKLFACLSFISITKGPLDPNTNHDVVLMVKEESLVMKHYFFYVWVFVCVCAVVFEHVVKYPEVMKMLLAVKLLPAMT